MNRKTKADEALRQSEAFNRTLVASIPLNLFLKDRNCTYLAVNDRHAESPGAVRSRVRGQERLRFLPA